MSNETRAASCATPPKELSQYGGQAVIEGVMMRSPRYFAVACRKPNGEIVVKREEVDKSILGRLKWLNKPFLRGTLALIDAMALGTRALAFASQVQMEAEQEAGNPNAEQNGRHHRREEEAASIANGVPLVAPRLETTAPADKPKNINDIAIGGTIAFSFVFGIALFVLLPTLVTGIMHHFGLAKTSQHAATWLNLSDGLIRMVIFFGYIGLISSMEQIKQVFMYHGAEHKAINTLEAGLPLTVENALRASRIHPRCGTSFIFIVLVINLIVFIFLPRPDSILLRFPLHVAVIPLVAGLSYEVIKFAGNFRRNPLVMAVFAPGMWSQLLTTREPNAGQVEVALASLYSVLQAEGHDKLLPACDPPAVVNIAEPEAALA